MDFLSFFIFVGSFCALCCLAYNTMEISRELRRIRKSLSKIAKHLEEINEKDQD